MSGRIWRFPDLRNGTTLHHITDTHFGGHYHAAWVNGWGDSVRDDLNELSVYTSAGHVHTGDMIHWYYGTGNPQSTADTESAWYVAWRDAVKAVDGKPWAEAVGNHDLLGPGEADSTRSLVTSTGWAQRIGVESQNVITDMGDFKVITVGPETWHYGTNFVLSQATLSFLDNALQNAGKPCWVAAHVPFNEQYNTYGGGDTAVEPGNPTLMALLDSNPNCIGWLSGHRHINIVEQTEQATTFSTGSRQIFGINGPASIGGRKGAEVAYDDHQWQAWNYSMYLTYLGDAVDVRWRDHNARVWTNPEGETVRHILLQT